MKKSILSTMFGLALVSASLATAAPAAADVSAQNRNCSINTNSATFAYVNCWEGVGSGKTYRIAATYCRARCTEERGIWVGAPRYSNIEVPGGGSLVNVRCEGCQ